MVYVSMTTSYIYIHFTCMCTYVHGCYLLVTIIHALQSICCLLNSTDPRCEGDLVYSDCTTSCGLNCDTVRQPELQPFCDSVCSEGCACPPGLIPLTSDLKETRCVPHDECPIPDCPPGQVYTDCGSSCGITCENVHLPSQFQPVCALVCSPGCFCEEGLIPLGPNDDTCVHPDQCPTAVCSMEGVVFPCLYVSTCMNTYIVTEHLNLRLHQGTHSLLQWACCVYFGAITWNPHTTLL